VILATLLLGALGQPAEAATVGSKNREANRLFEQGKYQEAEKAYLEAQAENPGKPELTYNLGNALLRQKKHKEALQALRQAVAKANRGLQANAWYNTGNALYETGSYKQAADAFVQALRINPADREAKQNLELALKKLEQQKQQQPQSGDSKNPPEDRDNPSQSPQQDDNQSKEQQKPKQQQGADQQHDREQPANPQTTQAGRSEGSLSKERALQILDALQNQELTEQRKMLERQARRKAVGRDW
jgi:tetratricopeptide (TPR) repeat protein